MSNIQSLLDHFLPYTYCPNCLSRSKARQNERMQKLIIADRTTGSVLAESLVMSQEPRQINEKVLRFFSENEDVDIFESDIAELVPDLHEYSAYQLIPDDTPAAVNVVVINLLLLLKNIL